jgi:membrane protein involved in colicin uptake
MTIQKERRMANEKKKSLFDQAIDALTDRDEKEAAARAAQEKALADSAAKEAEARSRMAAEKAAVQKAAADKAAAGKAATQRMAGEKAAERRRAVGAPAAQKKGVVTVRSLRIRADHTTSSEIVGGLVEGNEVTILGTWFDGRNTWAKLENGWAAMVYDGETYIRTG